MFKRFTFRVALDGMKDLQATLDSAERAGFKVKPIDSAEDAVNAVDVDGNELTMGRFVLDWWKRGDDFGGLVINLREDVDNHLSREEDLEPDYVAVLTDHGGDVMFDIKDVAKDKAEWFLEKITCGDLDTSEGILELGKETGGKVVSKRGRDGRYTREIVWKPFRSRYYNPPTEDGLSVNPATEEFKKIKKSRQTFQERVAELKDMYGDAFENAVPYGSFHMAQRQSPYAAKIQRIKNEKSVEERAAELRAALQPEEAAPADPQSEEVEPAGKETVGKE